MRDYILRYLPLSNCSLRLVDIWIVIKKNNKRFLGTIYRWEAEIKEDFLKRILLRDDFTIYYEWVIFYMYEEHCLE